MPQTCWKCGAPPVEQEILPQTNVNLPVPLNPLPSAPDLTALLTSNDIPLESDIPSVQKMISDGQNRVDALDAQIHDVQTTFDRLLQRRSEAANSVGRHRAILSAVRRVPADLICEIFSLVASGAKPIGSDRMNPPPWTLSHICRSWRNFALSYPLLWTFVEISPFTASSADMIETQLRLSGTAPLEIYWSGINDPQYVDARLLHVVLAQCSRWRTLHLKQLGDANLNWLNVVDGKLPQLETLQVHAMPDTLIPDVFSTAPALRRIILCDGGFTTSPAIVLPWGQITHYRGRYTTAAHQLELLKMAPNLVECAIGFDRLDVGHGGVILPNLRRLVLDINEFLDDLTTPTLDELHSTDADLDPVLPFIARSSCNLTKLVLSCFSLPTKLVPVLEALPSLTFLLVQTAVGGRLSQTALFESMTISGTPADICPHLESIAYGYVNEPSIAVFPQDLFFAMVRSRIQPNRQRRLLSLRLFTGFAETPTSDIEVALERLRHEGLDAVFLTREAEELVQTWRL